MLYAISGQHYIRGIRTLHLQVRLEILRHSEQAEGCVGQE